MAITSRQRQSRGMGGGEAFSAVGDSTQSVSESAVGFRLAMELELAGTMKNLSRGRM